MAPLLEFLRRPEFTGENRCWACTAVNGVLLWMGITIVTLLGQPLLAVALGLVGVATISLRGYLFPYTPRFAPQLVSLLPGDPFDHERAPGSLADAGLGSGPGPNSDTDIDSHATSVDGPASDSAARDPPSGDEILETLLDAGVLVSEGTEVSLEPDIRRTWHEEMVTLRELDIDALAAVADELTPETIDASGETRWGRSYVVVDSEDRPLVLLPHAIAVAELAAVSTLESAVADDHVRLAAGRPFRTLLERCPLCDGELTVSTSTCCGDVTPIGKTPTEKLVCPACSIRLFTYDRNRE